LEAGVIRFYCNLRWNFRTSGHDPESKGGSASGNGCAEDRVPRVPCDAPGCLANSLKTLE
jgi:hypothetical protein